VRETRIREEKLVLTRPFDRHLDSDELDALVSSQAIGVPSSGQLSEGAIREAQRHVDSCKDCQRKVQMHKSVQSEISRRPVPRSAPPGQDCIQDSEWVRVAAGLLSDSQTRELMKHAAQCGHCGPLLKNAAEAVVDEATPSEEALLASLQSARPEWRKNMAATLRYSVRDRQPKSSWWKAVFVSPAPAYALAGIVAVAALAWIGVRAWRPPSAEQLLAQAYTEHRTLEVRIPGAKYAPVQAQRGTERSDFDKPQSLLKAEDLIGENLRKNPADPVWLQARARADLLNGNYDSAIKSLQRARETQPDSPGLLIDLGSAYFVRAETAGTPIDYGNAIESFGKALSKSPDDPVALFNRALACERAFLYTQAIDDWEHYLRVDPRGGWADEAHKNLDTIQEQLRKHGEEVGEPLLTPVELATAADPEHTALLLDSRIEDYLRIAVAEWLPRAYATTGTADSADLDRTLRLLAGVAIQNHGDRWLEDLLVGASSKDFSAATKDLSEAIGANDKADTATAHKEAAEAASLFERANNKAGVLRSQFEYLVASNIDQDGGVCKQAGQQLMESVDNFPYKWLQVQTHLELGSCYWLREDIGLAKQQYGKATQESKASEFSQLYLRSQDHISALLAAVGDYHAAWRIASQGLATYWSGNYPDVRGYNFYDHLYELSRLANLPYVEVSARLDGVRLSESSPDLAQRALAHLLLASAAESANISKIPEIEFARASRLFAASPQGNATHMARLEAEIRWADAETRQGNPRQAVDRLKPLRQEIATSSDNFLALMFYTNLGEAEASQGDWDEAEPVLRAAISLSEKQLRTLYDDESRVEVVRQSSGAYRALVQRQLLMGDSQGALDLWEKYRGSALGKGQANLHQFPRTRLLETRSITRYLPALTKELVISYAFLPSGLALWTFDDRGLFVHWEEGKSENIATLAARFRTLCADPKSDLSELQQSAHELYDLLVAPVQDRLSNDRILVTELDGALDGVPFEALIDEHNRYLGDRGPIVSSLGIYYRGESSGPALITEDAAALIAAVPAPDAAIGLDVSPLPDVLREGEMVARKFRDTQLLEAGAATRDAVLSSLSSAVVFHFAGHAVNTSRQNGILISDALLTPSSLKASNFSQMRLAVLSACDTQDGPSGAFNDVDSLARVFLRAGVPNVVASRWSVDSEATRQFMELFYRNLLDGNSVSASVHQAQAALRSRPGTAHPYFWSAFTALGMS
jgi:CHAT domain-containing protein/cytochrome c-type biogenesis protein CcmH/NrfG